MMDAWMVELKAVSWAVHLAGMMVPLTVASMVDLMDASMAA